MFSGRIAISTLSPAANPVDPRDIEREIAGDIDGSAAIVQRAQSPRHQVHQPHEVRHHAVLRMGIDLERRAELLQASGVHHRHLVGERERLGLVVRDVDEGDAGAAL